MADTPDSSAPATALPESGSSTQRMEGGFVRKASGLVRDFSQVDAWIYNVLAINAVVLLAMTYVSVVVIFPGASLPAAIAICGFFCLFEAITYAFFTTIMPRSGGDYVFQSRVLGGGIATVFVGTGIVLTQFIIVALVGYLGATLVISPFFLLIGAEYGWEWLIDAGNWAASETGVFILAAAYMLWSGLLNLRGLRLYALVQRYLFGIGLACLFVFLILLLTTSSGDFVTNLNTFMSDNYGVEDAHGATLAAGGTPDVGFSLWATIQAAVFAALFLVFSHWSVQQGGEIKRANSLRNNLLAIPGSLIFSLALILGISALLVSKVGTDFLFASGSLFLDGSPEYLLPVPPFFGFFAVLTTTSPVFLWVAFVMFFTWFMMIAPNVPLACSRMMMAMSFDRILPEAIGRVHPRLHVPVNAILLVVIGGIGFSALYAYGQWFVPLTFALTLPTLNTFAATMVAAVLFPKRSPHIFRGSVADRYRIGPVSVMQITAAIFFAFVVFVDYQILFNDALGLNSTDALLTVGALYVVAIGVYLGSKIYRKRKDNLDLTMAYKELPAE